MTYESINRRYTELVVGYIAAGYCFNTTTMSGSQGEIAHVDLTNGDEIIRIVMGSFHNFEDYTEGIEIVVGRCTDKFVKPNGERGHDTIWNSQLEVITSEKFYQIGREKRDGKKWYGALEDAKAASEKQHERCEAKSSVRTCRVLSEDAKAAALRWIRKQPKCKSVKFYDIQSVYVLTTTNCITGSTRNEYYVEFKDKKLRIK